MANTLKFGAGEWATKEGSTLAYNDDNGNFKPLPFDFTRSTSATRVNKEGLIEVVSNNEPRIDFLNDSKGALLLEPSRSNLVTYSSEFDNSAWTKTRLNAFGSGSVVNAIVSPDGTTNADYIQQVTSQTTGGGVSQNLSITGIHSWSLFAKASECEFLAIRTRSATITSSYFNLTNGTVALADPDHSNVKIQSFGNGWYKCSVSDSGGALANRFIVGGRDGVSETVTPNNGIYIYGAQLEQGSYATSYIPTQGSIGTRVAESCNGAGNDQVFNDSEGVLYVETKGLVDVPISSGYIQLSKNGESSATNSLIIQHRNNGYLRVYVNGFATTDIHFNENIDFTENHKIAVLYKLNGYKLFIDGVAQSLYLTPTQAVFSGLDNLSFDLRGALGWDGNIKDVKLYDTALSDAELAALTKI